LDTKSKIFQFNGSNSCIQERAKALEVVQYIKDTFHEGKCEVAAVGKQIINVPRIFRITNAMNDKLDFSHRGWEIDG
jgi:hypothetical protein